MKLPRKCERGPRQFMVLNVMVFRGLERYLVFLDADRRKGMISLLRLLYGIVGRAAMPQLVLPETVQSNLNTTPCFFNVYADFQVRKPPCSLAINEDVAYELWCATPDRNQLSFTVAFLRPQLHRVKTSCLGFCCWDA